MIPEPSALSQLVPAVPSRATRVFFWLLIGLLSVFFAEVVIASDPYPFLHSWGLFIVIPLYLLHITVLARIAFQAPRLSFALLFLLGIVFGFYEAYITKVIWNPPWGPLYYLGGIAPIQTAVLTLWWHPWMALIVPLLVGETLLTGSREVIGVFSPWLRKQISKPLKSNWILLLFLVFCGFIQSSNAPTLRLSILSFFSTGIVILGCIMIWRWITWGKTYTLRSLLPQGEEFWILTILLVGMYGFLGRILRTEDIGDSIGQLVVIGSYIVLALMIFLEIRSIKKITGESVPSVDSWSLSRFLISLAIIIAAAVDSHVFLGAARIWIVPVAWLLGATSGITILVTMVYRVILTSTSSEQPDVVDNMKNF